MTVAGCRLSDVGFFLKCYYVAKFGETDNSQPIIGNKELNKLTLVLLFEKKTGDS